jgi:hypothetical protein
MRKAASLLLLIFFGLLAAATQRVPDSMRQPTPEPGPIENAHLADATDLALATDLLAHPPDGCIPSKSGGSGKTAVASTGGEISILAKCPDGPRVFLIKNGTVTQRK